MAMRPVFVPSKRVDVDVFMTEFQWNSGMSVSQKRKNIRDLHEAFRKRFPERQVLEISSKSEEPLGVALSAFDLPKFVPSLGRSVSVECAYQGSKVFAAGGPYPDLFGATSREAKKDPRLGASGMLRGFRFDGTDFPSTRGTTFYDWLYINALLEHPELAEGLLTYDAFTDIEFSPDKSVSCQAGAAARYVSLVRRGVIEQCRTMEGFLAQIR